MAAKKKETNNINETSVKRYRGCQLLRMEKYRNRIARIILKPDEAYSFSEADEKIKDYLKKKG